MFRCAKCNQLSKLREPAVCVVLEIREKIYPYREFAMRRGRGKKRKWIFDPGGTGFETIRESRQHCLCAAQNAYTAASADFVE